MNFYRRADGSTRVEEPNRVVIVDNSSHTVTVLDTVGKVAQAQNAPPALAKSITPPAALSLPQTGVNNPNTADCATSKSRNTYAHAPRPLLLWRGLGSLLWVWGGLS